MKRILLLLVMGWSLTVFGQSESEPNNDFAGATWVNAGNTVDGSVSNASDDDDYFKTVLPQDGTLTIYIQGTNTSANSGYLYMYGYDRRKAGGTVFGEYIHNTSTPAGATVYDTIRAYGRAADTFYFRMNSPGTFSYRFSYEMTDRSANDVEPNNNFEQATAISPQEEKQGHIGYLYNGTSDGLDYYRTVLPADGTVKIYIKATNTDNASGYLYMYGYDRRKASGTVFGEYIHSTSTAAGAAISDTITLYGRAADTFYFRIYSSRSFSYSFSYGMEETSANDVEPNDEFNTALPLTNAEQKAGHIGYLQNGRSDANDFYKTTLPFDGALKIMVEGTNKSGHAAYLYLNGYDKRKASGTVFGTYISGNTSVAHNQAIYDTIIVTSQLADSFFFRINATGAFQYKISYEMIEDSPFDEEPNNTFEEAVHIGNGIGKTGQVGYTGGGTTDNFDYYKTVIPTDGTLKIYVTGTNTSANAGYLYMYGYDRRKASGTIFGEYIQTTSAPAGTNVSDTITVYGRAADTFYFRLTSSQSFSYGFSYQMVDTSANDAEPDNNFDETIQIAHKETKEGHIGYLYNGTSDNYDYYKTTLPTDGTLKVYVKGTNTSGISGYLYLDGYDRRKASGTIFSEYINSTSTAAGVIIYDTILAYGRAADTFYFRVRSSNAFSYSLSYEMIDTSAVDAEPNDSYGQSISISHREIREGHIGYMYNGTADRDDYYQTVLPSDGTMKVYVKGTNTDASAGYLYLYGHDRRQASGTVFSEYINSTSTAAGAVIYDTIIAYGRAADTFYFRVNSSRAFSYSISYEMADTSTNDAEPNDNFETALPMDAGELKSGHIGYLQNGTADANDYYKTVLPKNGTVKIYVKAKNTGGKASWLYLYAFDSRKASGTVLSEYIGSTSSKADSTIYDTLLIHCRAIDTLYFRMNASGAFAYEFSYEMDGDANADAEPNNSFETAAALTTNTVTAGRAGYYRGGVADANDYYKMPVPKNGHARFFFNATNTSNGNGRLQVTLYNSTKRSFGTQVITGNNNIAAGISVRDTLVYECIATDTLYVVVNANTCFSYDFMMEFEDKEPEADMTYERMGNTFGFRPQLSNADKFLWTFGDTTSSTSPYPMKTYLPGNYTARLIATNETCNFSDTAFTDFVIKGVEYYTPQKGGVGGDINLSFFGGGIGAGTVVKLTKGATVLTPIEFFTNSEENHFTSIFDIHLAEPGDYDITVQIPGEELISYPGGFSIVPFSYPTTWSEVKGPDRWRTNLDTKFSLVVGNHGNVAASGVVVALAWPKEVEINFEGGLLEPPTTGVETVMVDGETFSLPRSEYRFIYDDLQTITPIDTFNFVPYNGHIRYFLIPHVPAGTTVEFPFIAKSAATGGASFKTYTFKTNQRGSCDNPVFTNYNEDVTAELIDVLDMGIDQYGPPPLKVLSKTAKIGQKHAGSAASYYGKKFWAWYDGYEFDGDAAMADLMKETEANNAFALQTATDELGGLLFDKGTTKVLDKYQGQVDFINKRLANNPNMSAELTDKYLDKLNSLPHGEMKRLEALKGIFKNTKDLGTLSDKLVKLQQLADDCPELKEQIEELKKDIEKELNIRDPREKETNRVTSLDPNEISGPSGKGANRYVNNLDAHVFHISFENVDTAQASAQIVIVRDTLDKTKYDLSTFEFGNISIGSKTHRLPKGRNQFVLERRIQQDLPMKVRINGSIDTLTGVVEWQFTSLDTNTNRLPVLEGFLPPNISKPEGQGSVGFTVKPLQTLDDGAIFLNQATIIFDQNEPILTNVWKNILDTGKPNSSLSATVSEDTLIHLALAGFDGVSGVGYYHVNVAVNNGEWISFTGTSSDTLTLSGQQDSTYHFYIVSQDKVGNLEDKAPGAELSVTLSKALAVTMGPINAENAGDKNEVYWSTYGEMTGDYFILQRSSDGTHFTAITTLAANGRPSSYRYTDSKPMPGRNYYRLQLYNAEGEYVYSKIVSAVVESTSAFAIELYPNPASDVLKINMHGDQQGKARITLNTVQGHVLADVVATGSYATIDISKLSPGIYFIKYQDERRQQTVKFVKR